jgi:hypothetical protein
MDANHAAIAINPEGGVMLIHGEGPSSYKAKEVTKHTKRITKIVGNY